MMRRVAFARSPCSPGAPVSAQYADIKPYFVFFPILELSVPRCKRRWLAFSSGTTFLLTVRICTGCQIQTKLNN